MNAVKITKEKLLNIVLPQKGVAPVDKYTLDNGSMSVEIINLGATITGIYVPDINDNEDDVVLGFESPLQYMSRCNPYMGATIGRYAHVISEAQFAMDGKSYYLSMNDPPHFYHGGVQGFDKKIWDARVEDNCLVMTYRSTELESGFPGDVCVKVKFHLTTDNELIILYTANATAKTPINLTNECYFNLAGHGAGKEAIYEHELKICTDYYVVMEEGRPTGLVDEVESTFYDLREPINVGDVLAAEEEFSDDAVYCFAGSGLKNVAQLRYPDNGRCLTVYTDQPCLILKIAQDFNEMEGKEEKCYGIHSGVCLQTGNLPDAVNIKCFPNPYLLPNQEYRHTIVWKFTVEVEEGEKECSPPAEPVVDLQLEMYNQRVTGDPCDPPSPEEIASLGGLQGKMYVQPATGIPCDPPSPQEIASATGSPGCQEEVDMRGHLRITGFVMRPIHTTDC